MERGNNLRGKYACGGEIPFEDAQVKWRLNLELGNCGIFRNCKGNFLADFWNIFAKIFRGTLTYWHVFLVTAELEKYLYGNDFEGNILERKFCFTTLKGEAYEDSRGISTKTERRKLLGCLWNFNKYRGTSFAKLPLMPYLFQNYRWNILGKIWQ